MIPFCADCCSFKQTDRYVCIAGREHTNPSEWTLYPDDNARKAR